MYEVIKQGALPRPHMNDMIDKLNEKNASGCCPSK